MPTLTVKDVIKAELLKVCLDVTRKLRDKENKKDKKRKFSREEVADIEKLSREMGWEATKVEKQMKIYSILHAAPELKAGSMLPLELFAVVLIGPGSHHNYPAGKPLIVTGKDGHLWNPSDGAVASWRFIHSDNPVYATDEQVEQCIKDLTPVQLNRFYTLDVFIPIKDAAMNRMVTVEEATVPNGELADDEIELADGRKITVGSG